jgi:hypothetical protein
MQSGVEIASEVLRPTSADRFSPPEPRDKRKSLRAVTVEVG